MLASTITQQLVKNILLKGPNYIKKNKRINFITQNRKRVFKEFIIELYLNEIILKTFMVLLQLHLIILINQYLT